MNHLRDQLKLLPVTGDLPPTLVFGTKLKFSKATVFEACVTLATLETFALESGWKWEWLCESFERSCVVGRYCFKLSLGTNAHLLRSGEWRMYL